MTRSAPRLALVIAATFLGCSEPLAAPSATRTPTDKTASVILDGSHGGNKHFFFLPPMVSGSQLATFTGESDSDQSPTVVVCEWKADSDGSCGAIVAQFGRGDGSTAGDMTYDATAQQYKVNWKTDQCTNGPCTLDVSKTYRLRVLIGAYEIGHADLDVVSNGSELKNVLTGEYIGLVDGRTLPIKFRIEKGAVSVVELGVQATIGTDGGVIATSDGSVSLDFPVGALSAEKAIAVKQVTESRPGVGAWAAAVDLGPDGTTFAKPVTLTLGFDATKLPQGVTPSAVAIYTWVGDSWERVGGSTVNESDNTVSAPISHFSQYVVSISPNYMAGRPAYSFVVGDVGRLTGYTVAYDVAANTYCYTVRVQKRFLFWTRWVWEQRCYTVYTPYQYFPAGLRLYWYFPSGSSSTASLDCSSLKTCYTVVGYDGQMVSPVLRANAVGAVSLAVNEYPGGCFDFMGIPFCGVIPNLWLGPVNVVRAPVNSVAVSPSVATLSPTTPGNTQQLTAILTDANGNDLTGRSVTWSSSDQTVAKVDAFGSVTAVGPGNATITATSEGQSGTARINVLAQGHTVVFDALNPSTSLTEIVIQQSDGSGQRVLTSYNLAGQSIGSLARWSPTDPQLVFQITNPQAGDLYLINEDGTNQRQLTRNTALNAGAAFSPDGKKIIFTSTRTSNYELWIMNADGTGQTQLTHSAAEEYGAAFSPDGSQIAFNRGDGAGREIWIMNATANPDGSYTEHRVTANGGQKSAPCWSPDGKKILVSREYVLYLVDATAIDAPLSAMTLINTPGLSATWPDWAADGKILFTATGYWDSYLVNADGTGLEKIPTPSGLQAMYPSFKPVR
jgi:Tol biopolymer transport system component